jgi:hypothetical protein
MGFIKTFIEKGISEEFWAKVDFAPVSPVIRMKKSRKGG